MAKGIRTPQDEARDREQIQIFEHGYQQLIDAAKGAAASLSLDVAADRLKIDLKRDRTARGAMTVGSGKKV